MPKPSKLWLAATVLVVACTGHGVTELPGEEPRSESPGGAPAASEAGGATSGGRVGAGGGVTLTIHPDVATNVSPPTQLRSCIQAALERQDTAAAGAATVEPNAGAAGSIGGNPTAADLGLGAGDLTVLVLFDQSGSMASGWDERSKWQVANEALMSALDPVLDLVTIGTIFFPQPSECDVAALDSGLQFDFLSGRNFRSRWEATADARGPSGSTPLGLAMQVADMAIEKACHLGLLERRFRVVIVTDGEPNCGVNINTLPDLPAQWRRLGIETRVMGLPGSQPALNLMDRIARAGGTEKCLSLGSPQQMKSEMQQALL